MDASILQLLKGIGGIHSSSLIPKLGEILFVLITKFPVESKQIMIKYLKNENFPTENISASDKERFIKDVVSTRKLQLFKEFVRAFSCRCRGLAYNL